MPEIGSTGVKFAHVAREWRCKYAIPEGGPGASEPLKRAQALLDKFLPQLKALSNAEVTRVVCGGCGDFKVIINQPAADHDAWKAAGYPPEDQFMAELKAIEGTSRHETQEFTMEKL